MKKSADTAGKRLFSVYFMQMLYFLPHFFFYMGQKLNNVQMWMMSFTVLQSLGVGVL